MGAKVLRRLPDHAGSAVCKNSSKPQIPGGGFKNAIPELYQIAEEKNDASLGSSLFLLATAFFSLFWFQKQKNASYLITHTYQVKLKIEKCFGLLLEGESSQRGFLISRDSTYLFHLGHAESMLFSSLKQLDSLVADNPDQVGNSEKLQNLSQLRLKRLNDVLDSVEHLNKISITYTSPGRAMMDSVHEQVKTMESTEDTLLAKRNQLKHKQDNYISFFIILFSILAYTILIWSFLKIRNENILRLKAEVDVDLLEKRVSERTAEIKNINLLKDHRGKGSGNFSAGNGGRKIIPGMED